MGLKEEIEEVGKAWARAPWWMRAWLVLSVYLSISAIAALSETVLHWKSFILDGLHFYHSWIGRPFASVLALLNIHLTRAAADIFILYTLLFAATCRLFAVNTDWRDKVDKYGTLAMLVLPVAAMIFYLYRTNNRTGPPSWSWIAGLLLVPLLLPILLRFEHKRAFYLPIAVALFIVGILAAINIGLSK